MPARSCVVAACAAAALGVLVADYAWAIGPSNVLVLYKSHLDGEPLTEGEQIADYYAQTHPGVRLLGLNNIGTGDEITASEYLNTIRPQVVAALTPDIDVIVTTKGLPVRIQTTESFPSYPASYTDPQGDAHNVYSTSWRRYSSLESELTRVDTISTWKQMLDQTWWDTTLPSAARNPYYNAATAFNRGNPAFQGIRLTSRLDGFTVADVTASIDRAQQAFVGPFSFVVDDDPSKSYDLMGNLVNQVLAPRSEPYLYDDTSTFVGVSQGPVIGYVSHGRNQSSTPPGYILDSANGLQFDLAAGAVFHTWESYNAYSFTPGGNYAGQGLVAEWLARGGTAGAGNVQEPGANAVSVTNEDIMFRMLLDGYTWAEAAWSATNQLSFVNTVVGDPLLVWRPLMPGDADMDGLVGSADLARLAANWGAVGGSGGAMWGAGDFNGDGRVGSEDLALIAANWGARSNWAAVGGGAQPEAGLAPPDNSNNAIPEPSARVLGALGVISLLVHWTLRGRPPEGDSRWKSRRRIARSGPSATVRPA
jgi:uncharacterized protein (TIGR03790 family)